MSLAKYSGFEWVGEIPNEWNIGRIAHRYQLTLGKMVESDAGFSSRIQYPYLCAANIKWQGIDASIQKVMHFTDQERRYYEVHEGDLLITEGGSIGTSCIYEGEFGPVCYMQNSVIRARGKNLAANKFLAYWLEFVCNSGYLDVLCNKATIAHYTKDKVGKTPFPLMQRWEYEEIVKSIDRVCVPINKAIEVLEDGISILERYRASIIHDAVTKGINQNVRMKPSGVDWIGDIPENWKINKLKYADRFISDSLPKNTSLDFTFRYVDIGSVTYENGIEHYTEMNFGESPSRARKRVAYGDTIVSTVRTYLKAIAMVEDDDNVIVSTGFSVIRPYMHLPRYLYYLCCSEFFCQQVEKYAWGIAYPAISEKLLGLIWVPMPPKKEQEVIAAFLDKRTSIIDAALETKRKQIDVLKRRRQSLIYEYVTGKRRVRKEM